jgi:tetratricopeptide (TPR) repeat protein
MSLFNRLFGKKPTTQPAVTPQPTTEPQSETKPKVDASVSAPKPKPQKKDHTKPELSSAAHATSNVPWRTFSIFISSTFADMQAERDHLKNVVFPKVEEELEKRRIKLEVVDLRWGVDTTTIEQEDKREANVLKVCLDEIKRCRPFFIGLLGDRYGWVPSEERIKTALVGETYLKPEKGKSVTDLEIEFGVLASQEQLVRSVFYFRGPLPYSSFSKKKAAMFSEDYNPELNEKEKKERKDALEKLKTNIVDHFKAIKQENKVKTYTAKWDAEKEKVIDLKAWGDIVYTDILAECENHAKDTWDKVPQNWQEQEQALLNAFIEQHTHVTTSLTEKGNENVPTFCGRTELLKKLKMHLLSDDSDNWGLILTGESGSGKSAIFSMMNKIMQQEECFILAHSTGLSPKAKSVAGLLKIWNRQLTTFAGLKEELMDGTMTDDEQSFQMPGQPDMPKATPIEKLQEKFLELLYLVSAKKRVLLLIDALDRFEPTPRAQHMSWLPPVMPKNVRMLCTVITGGELKATQYHKGLIPQNIEIFSKEEAQEMLDALCMRNHKTLAEKVRKIILEKKRNDGKLAISSPLWLSLAVNMLMSVDQDDFEKMSRLDGKGGEQIETYLVRIANEFDPLPGSLFISLTQKAGAVFGNTFTKTVFEYLAISRNGLREKDLEILLSDKHWDSLQFANLRRWFKTHLVLQGEELQWNLVHSILKNAIIEQIHEKILKQLHSSISSYLLTLTSDPMKADETMYHLLKSGNLGEAVEYYSGDMNIDEIAGATDSLTETISSDEKGLEIVCSFPDLLRNNDKRKQVLVHRFIFELNYALKRNNLLKERSAFLAKIEIVAEKIRENPDLDLAFMYDRMALASSLGDAYEILGNNEKALKYFILSSELADELCRVHPMKQVMKFSLAISNLHLGDISATMGAGEAALKYYLVAYDQLNELHKTNESNESLLENLTIAIAKLGTLYFEFGKTDEALKHFLESKELSYILYRINPLQENIVDLHAVSYEKLGDIYLAMGHKEKAFSCYKSSNTLSKEAYSLNPMRKVTLENLLVSYSKLGTVCLEMGDTKKALSYFEIYLNMSEEQSIINPNNFFLEKNFSIGYLKLSSTYQELGDWEKALECANTFKNMSEILSGKYPESELIKYQLAESYEELGKFNKKKSNFNEAFALYAKSLKIKKSLYEANPRSERLKGGYANVLERTGAITLDIGNVNESLFYYEKSENLYRELYLSDPLKVKIKSNLALIISSLGHVQTTLGNTKSALKYYTEGLQLSKELFNTNPDNFIYQDDLITASIRLGELYKDMGYLDEALRNFMIANHLLKKICDEKPADIYHKDLLVSSYSDLGKIYESANYTKEALHYYTLSYEVSKELYNINPLDRKLKKSYSVSCSKLGSIYMSVNNKVKALELFETDMKLTEELNKDCVVDEELKNDMAISYEQLGAIHQSLGNLKKACYYMEKDLEIMKGLSNENPNDFNILEDLGKVYNNLAKLYKASGNYSLGKERFAEWKNIISILSENLPQEPKYNEWDKIEY